MGVEYEYTEELTSLLEEVGVTLDEKHHHGPVPVVPSVDEGEVCERNTLSASMKRRNQSRRDMLQKMLNIRTIDYHFVVSYLFLNIIELLECVQVRFVLGCVYEGS